MFVGSKGEYYSGIVHHYILTNRYHCVIILFVGESTLSIIFSII